MIIAVDGQRSATVRFRFKKKKKTVLDWSQDSSAVPASSRPAKAPFFFLPGRREIVVGHCQCQDWASPYHHAHLYSQLKSDKKVEEYRASSRQPSSGLSSNDGLDILLSQN